MVGVTFLSYPIMQSITPMYMIKARPALLNALKANCGGILVDSEGVTNTVGSWTLKQHRAKKEYSNVGIIKYDRESESKIKIKPEKRHHCHLCGAASSSTFLLTRQGFVALRVTEHGIGEDGAPALDRFRGLRNIKRHG